MFAKYKTDKDGNFLNFKNENLMIFLKIGFMPFD